MTAPPDPRYFPETNYFPPPPTQPVDPQYAPPPNAQFPPYNQYNPADYPPPNAPPAGYMTPPPPVHAEPGNPYAPRDPGHRRPDDHVSAPSVPEHISRGGSRLSPTHGKSNMTNMPSPPDRLSSPIAPAPVQPAKSVQFDLNPQEQVPEPERRHQSPDRNRNRDQDRDRKEGDRRRDREEKDNRGRSRNLDGAKNRNHRRRDDSPDSIASDATIELPPRFDEHGRRKGDDPVADKLESVLKGLFV